MSIKILTIPEAEQYKKIAEKYGEAFEWEIGLAKQDYYCDNSGVEIPKGTRCAAVMVLPDDKHPNYDHQKNMLRNYLQ
jgi:hypothetical protein